jgi:hypothetical protein
MEGDYLWAEFCKLKNYPKNFTEFQKLYPSLTQEELDGLMEDQIHEFERCILQSKLDISITMKIGE